MIALGARLALNPVLGAYSPYLISTLAVIAAAWYGGRAPGFASMALSALGIQFFLIEPRYSFAILGAEQEVDLAVFLVVGSLISLLVGHLRESLLSTSRAEESLRRNAQLVDLSHDAIITTDSKGRITGWNNGAEEMYGLKKSEALGKSINDLTHTGAGITTAGIKEILHDAGRWDGELHHVALEGQELVVDSRQVLLRDDRNEPVGLLEINRDITAQKQANHALEESESQFRALANAIPQLCWMANPDGWIFWYNQRWYEYTGTTPQQMEGWGWQSVHDPVMLPKVLEGWRGSIATGEPFDMVLPLRGADQVFPSVPDAGNACTRSGRQGCALVWDQHRH